MTTISVPGLNAELEDLARRAWYRARLRCQTSTMPGSARASSQRRTVCGRWSATAAERPAVGPRRPGPMLDSPAARPLRATSSPAACGWRMRRTPTSRPCPPEPASFTTSTPRALMPGSRPPNNCRSSSAFAASSRSRGNRGIRSRCSRSATWPWARGNRSWRGARYWRGLGPPRIRSSRAARQPAPRPSFRRALLYVDSSPTPPRTSKQPPKAWAFSAPPRAAPTPGRSTVHARRTGKPVICNDSHRGLDVPNAYWQVHVSCPAFNVIGGYVRGASRVSRTSDSTARVAWNITHTQADYQDLYIETFRRARDVPDREAGLQAEPTSARDDRCARRSERDTSRPGRRATGRSSTAILAPAPALSMRYTATDQPCTAIGSPTADDVAATVEQLFDAQRPWVDPVNNLVAADTARHDRLSHARGGCLSATQQGRAQPSRARLDGQHEWTGSTSRSRRCRERSTPPKASSSTANQRVLDSDEPYISDFFAPPYRADRLVELFGGERVLSPDEIAAAQRDRVSIAARAWVRAVRPYRSLEGDAEKARTLLARWDANLLPESAEALLYAYARREITRSIVTEAIGAETCDLLFSERNPAYGRVLSAWLSNVVYGLEGALRDADPCGRPWSAVLQGALSVAWASAVAAGGPTRTPGAGTRHTGSARSMRSAAPSRTWQRRTRPAARPRRRRRRHPPGCGVRLVGRQRLRHHDAARIPAGRRFRDRRRQLSSSRAALRATRAHRTSPTSANCGGPTRGCRCT